MVYKFLDKTSISFARPENLVTQTTPDKSDSVVVIKNENMLKQESVKKLPKPVIRKFEKRKVPSSFINNIWVLIFFRIQILLKKS